MKYSEITNKIIQAYYEVYNKLGIGFEKDIYINALAIKMKALDLQVENYIKKELFFENELIGELVVDMYIEDCIILKIENKEFINIASQEELINHLKATNQEVGLLLNFGYNADFKRKENILSDQNLKDRQN